MVFDELVVVRAIAASVKIRNTVLYKSIVFCYVWSAAGV
jgi:hypothetical protein